ncbi:dephospho-CoA kinase [Taylorella equigenitalis]|uniref:dephospho-CoA kinase n=1 Tax=Taylorella equigenitalis TaxID=29575 RepID=UPI00041BD5A5|nr:dephospho-CoA kinase [Taylorella equigenitalis]ASY37271.1 dephospho-CoA kinase [Taylorella equigenitalis]KGK33499.1 dephospho-CoA kinase [Taylorella equigenitalis]WDU46559.1 dephospho-CoA kinase [Taylorella equigenitalis]WDU48042.1 dephospho-CoA kinase [Taylorella equigenitalis]WDU52027.1 dephospho-CoA kinase [Taylorella equigenitalis]
MKILKVGLTGGIGSGKSTVAKFFEEKGIPVVDADKVSRLITASNGVAIEAIRAEFGSDYIDDTLAMDRTKMRELIFSDPKAKTRLEGILHPLIRSTILEQVSEAVSSGIAPYVIADIPLLIESYEFYRSELDVICAVDCDIDTQIARVQKRNNFNRAKILEIIHSQASRDERLKHADFVIDNGSDTTLEGLRLQVDQVHLELMRLHENHTTLRD